MKQNTPPAPKLVELRGPSGRLYGMIDPQRMVIEFKRGTQTERIDLSQYRKADPKP